jgi:hypothetical protein
VTPHPSEDLLQQFTQGELGEHLAIHVAEHIDMCPTCASRTAMLEPLHAVFAAVPDPEVPPGLIDAILRQADSEFLAEEGVAVDVTETVARTEVGIGLALLTLASLVLVVAEGPIQHLEAARQVLSALHTAAHHGLSHPIAVQGFTLAALLSAMGFVITSEVPRRLEGLR